jgi:hypothetical protein
MSDAFLPSVQGEWVWVKPTTQDDLPFAGKVLRTDKDRTLVMDDDNREVWVSKSQVNHELALWNFPSITFRF